MFQSLLGLLIFPLLAWAMSEEKSRVSLRLVGVGIGIQLILGLILLKFAVFKEFFLLLNRVVLALEKATRAGTSFVFGYLGGGEPPFEVSHPEANFILAFQSLPLVLLTSALSALLFYWKVLPVVVKGFSKALEKSMQLGGAEGLAVSVNIFLGMVEAPLFIRPYLERMSRSELFTLMSSGMATIAGTVMVLYATILQGVIPDITGHILTASIISAPAAVTIAKIMVPRTGPATAGELVAPEKASSAMDALTKGTIQGVQLLLNIVAMLVVLVALVSLINQLLGLFPAVAGEPLSLERILGGIMAPIVWCMGIPWSEALTAGSLMGVKTVLNEFIAYIQLSNLEPGALSERSLLIMTYGLCGFANPGSLGIMLGGLSTMAPSRQEEIMGLGVRSVVAGTLAACMTGAVVGLLR